MFCDSPMFRHRIFLGKITKTQHTDSAFSIQPMSEEADIFD